MFLHLQDPNGDYANDPELRRRMAAHSARFVPDFLRRYTPARIIGWLYRKITGKPHDDYVSKTNRALLKSGLIKTPLTVQDVYSITDIHVQDGRGISLEQMKSWMPGYRCVSRRSYGFFGRLWSTLSASKKREEERLFRSNAQNGFHVSAAWVLDAPYLRSSVRAVPK
jgi:hypothetical protein